tara:strand:+ start:546 stop:1163 length:618 start_codon:yes stop_codon:yes gene_type:complete
MLLVGTISYAHGGENHEKQNQDSIHATTEHFEHNLHNGDNELGQVQAESHSHGHELKAFPTLHPLVVHFPIVLLIIASLLQWFALFVYKKEISTVAWILLILGFVGAYASSTWFHAHTSQLSPDIKAVLLEHEKFASYTQWFSGIALLVQSINIFFLKRNFWVGVFVAVLMSIAAVFVAFTGHHGAELVHKHGVGAKGYLLESHH